MTSPIRSGLFARLWPQRDPADGRAALLRRGWVLGLVAATFLLPALHPTVRPVVGPASHLLWFVHVLVVALVAYAGGLRAGLAAVVASAAWVAVGERLFGAGYGVAAETATVLAMTIAVGIIEFVVVGFAVWVRNAEERRRQLSRVAMAAIERAPDALVLLDQHRRITLANRAASRVLRMDPGTMRGRPIAEFLDQPVPDGEWPADDVVIVRRGDGSLVPAEWVATPIGDGASRPAWLVTLRDATEQLREDQARQRTMALAELGELLAGIAHELNNPLAGVLGYAELLEADAELAADDRDAVRAMAHEARRAAGIAQRLLHLVRRREPERRPVQVADLVRTLLRVKLPSLTAHRVCVVEAIADDLPPVHVDPGEIEQILANLIGNARQAINGAQESGTIWVVARCATGGQVELRIEDDGPGVPEDQRQRIFEPFFTTKGPGVGTGLGLAICLRIARAHGGDLVYEPSRHGGAGFVVRLPAASGAAAVPETAAAVAPVERAVPRRTVAPRPVTGERRALIVDDEPAIRATVRRMLEREGFRVDEAASGAEAGRMFDRCVYSVVLCDMRLADATGEAVYREATRRCDALEGRFIFVTGDALSPDVEAFVRGSRERWILKPFEMRALVEEVRSVAA